LTADLSVSVPDHDGFGIYVPAECDGMGASLQRLGTGPWQLHSLGIDHHQSDDWEISDDALKVFIEKILQIVGTSDTQHALTTRHGPVNAVTSSRAWKALATAISRQLPQIEALGHT